MLLSVRTTCLLRVGFVGVVALLLFISLTGLAQASGLRVGGSYVALGDSYAAGEGLGAFEAGTDVKKGAKRNQCHRSLKQAFSDLSPSVVRPTVRSRAFWACSGATVDDMEHTPPQVGKQEQFNQPKQISTVSGSTRWITVSVGGDDVGFGAIGLACGGAEFNHLVFKRVPGKPPCTVELARQATKLAKLQRDLERLYHTLLQNSPNARLVVVGYPRVFPASYNGMHVYQGKSYCILDHYPLGTLTIDIGMPITDAKAVDAFEVKLNATILKATQMGSHPGDARRVRFANTYGPATPRNCKGTTPGASVTGLQLSPGFNGIGPWYKAFVASGSFHPTAAGQKMMARVIESAFGTFSGPASVSVTNPGNQTSTVGTHVSLQIQASDTDGGALTYSATALPGGLSLNPTTGLIAGTPMTAGSSMVTLTIHDATGPSGSTSFTWIINASAGATAVQIAVGGNDSCALLSGGGIDCWGLNDLGQLGIGTTSGPSSCPRRRAILCLVQLRSERG